MAEIKEEDHVASRALKDHPQVKKKSINPLANSSASGAPTIVLSMNEEERTPINKSKLGQEPEGVSMPGEAELSKKPPLVAKEATKISMSVSSASAPRSLLFSNYHIFGWLLDRVNNLEDSEELYEAMLVAAETSTHARLRAVANEFKEYLKSREAIWG